MSAAWQLLATLLGVTLLFGCAQANGALAGAARQAVRLCRGRAPLLPPLFFLLAAVTAMVGPGAILSTALIAPLAMSTGARAGVPVFLTALMVGNGANAGNLSPFSTVGVIVSGLMTRSGLPGHELRVWFFHAAAHAAVAALGYLLFGGLSLARQRRAAAPEPAPRLEPRHLATLAVTGAWIAGVTLLRWPLGWSAMALAAVLLAARAADWRTTLRQVPWKVIALVTGISTLAGWVEQAGGLVWFQDLLARLASPATVHALVAFLMGVISAYSSTSGVVLPAFLPMAPGVAARLPGVDPLALAISVNIGAALVDVSPLSTLGALCIAAAPPGSDRARLFRQLLWWGLAMSVAGAGFCYLASPLFAEGG